MVAISFGLVERHANTSVGELRTLPCYFALFGLAALFQIAVSLDALKSRNVIQLVGILFFQLAMIVFGALQVRQTKTALVSNPGGSCQGSGYVTCSGPDSLYNLVQPFQIVIPVVLAITLVLLCWFVWKLYHEFGWVVFHIVGANPKMKTMFRYYQVLIVLLKFDFFMFTATTMQLLILVLARNGAEFPITIIAIPIVLVLLAACVYAVKYEVKWIMIISLILMLPAQAYFVYKFVRLWMPESRERYAATRGTLAVSTIVSFIMLLSTFVVGIRCFADFDKDLKGAKTIEGKLDQKLDQRPTSTFSAVASSYATPERGSAFYGGQNGSATNFSMRDIPERSSSYAAGSQLAKRISIE
ncbi:hypothetical protein FRC03_002756 [Tulasnella sp. 419]|nr:hypothetical protein FRC02_000086 [Tulasnella sp. 418]KAG8969480.1 hypothetical protein FRC03_002756 [Tulasnella sp. 419]